MYTDCYIRRKYLFYLSCAFIILSTSRKKRQMCLQSINRDLSNLDEGEKIELSFSMNIAHILVSFYNWRKLSGWRQGAQSGS